MNRRADPVAVATAVLAIEAIRHYGYYWAEGMDRAMVSKALGSAAMLAYVAGAYYLRPSRLLAWIGAWAAVEELQVIIGCAWYMLDPWPVPPGSDILSARSGLNIAALSIVAVSYLAYRAQAVISDSALKMKGTSK